MINYCFVMISASMYAFAYWASPLMWWGSYASMVPLFMLHGSSVIQYVCYGMVWACISYSFHLWGVISGVASLASYSTWYAWAPGFFFILYLSVFTGCMWGMSAWGKKRLGLCDIKIPSHYIFWALIFILYWHLITYYILLPLGKCEGCLFLNPIIPLARYPLLLIPVSYVGVSGYTSVCISIIALSMYCYIHTSYQNKIVIGLIFLCILVYMVYDSIIIYPINNIMQHVIVGIPKFIGPTKEWEPACRLLSDYVAAAVHPQHTIGVVFPESSVYAWQICAESLLADFVLLSNNHVQDYIIGSFYDDDGIYRNSCYWLHGGKLQKRFDKRHAMPLIERIPWMLQCSLIRRLFFMHMPEIVPSDNVRPFMMLGEYAFVPYICSELFFNKTPDDIYPDLPILALVNDRWSSYEYVKDLMYLGAVVQAYAWRREIMYVSYSRSVYIIPIM